VRLELASNRLELVSHRLEMNTFLPSLLLCLSVLTYTGSAQEVSAQCQPPRLDNGVVEAEEGDNGNFFSGKFRCNPGYTLSGPSWLKCRNGMWSGSEPVCTVSGCDPKNLPQFDNGNKRKVRGMRDSVFRYKCNRGFRLFGPKNVYCTKNGWKMDTVPVCARFGCDETELLGEGVIHGRSRSMFQGAVYRFYCESGAMMEGSSAVYCDGYSWNGTKPECLVPPTPPELSIELDGVEASKPLASVGQQLKLVCKAKGGNPIPNLTFMLNGERVEADNKEMSEHGYNAVHTLVVEDHHANLEMSCIAQNRMSSIPVASNHQTLSVKFGPSNTYIHGADMLKPGDDAEYSCTSDESNPASELTVHITDQDGNDIDIEMTKLPKMKVNTGFASKLEFKFRVQTHFKSVFMKCDAANADGLATTGLGVQVMFPPTKIDVSGPEYLTSLGDESELEHVFTCTSDESNPVADIEWVVDYAGVTETITEDSTAVETFNQGLGWMKISTLSLPTPEAGTVKIHCVVTVVDLGFTQDSNELVVNVFDLPGVASISGPHFVSLNSNSEFECVSSEVNTEAVVVWSLTNLKREPVHFFKESDNKISVTVNDPLGGLIVECFVENLAGRGPVQTKMVDIHYPPQVEIRGPEQLLPATLITYSCSATQEAVIDWTVTNHEGEEVAFNELSSQMAESGDFTSVIETFAHEEYEKLFVSCIASNEAGEGYAEIVAHAVESPKIVQISTPDQLVAGSSLQYRCMSPISSPQQDLRWEVTDWQGEGLDFESENTGIQDGYTTSLLHITAKASARILTVKCVAYNYVGYVEDVSQSHLTYFPEAVHLTGPTSVLASQEAVFHCSAEASFPAPSLQWNLDGQDVTADAVQTDKMEDGGGVTSASVLRLNPSMGGHWHEVKCSVGQADIYKATEFQVQDLSIQLLGIEEGSELTDNDEIKVTCTMKDMPGLTSVKWYMDNQLVHEEDLTLDQGMMVASWTWFPEVGSTLLECRPEVEGIHHAESARVSFEVIESDYGYGEDVLMYDYEDADEQLNYGEDYEENYDDEEAYQENIIKQEEHVKDQENIAVGEEDKENSIEENEYIGKEEYSDGAKDYKGNEEEYYDGEEDYSDEEHEYNEEIMDTIYEDSSNEYSEDAIDAVSTDSINIEDTEAEDATNTSDNDHYEDIEDLSATSKHQSFKAAESGPAVLSHESDSSKHMTADLFSPKPLYSATGTKTCSVSLLISIIIGSIIRLLN